MMYEVINFAEHLCVLFRDWCNYYMRFFYHKIILFSLPLDMKHAVSERGLANPIHRAYSHFPYEFRSSYDYQA